MPVDAKDKRMRMDDQRAADLEKMSDSNENSKGFACNARLPDQ